MTIYAIGDVQGCYDPLQRLLDKLKFDPENDTLWFTGDLVNRGPKSLKTLRFIKSLGKSAVCVLGNHDLHLLAASITGSPRNNKSDTIKKILDAPDCEELINWLRRRPLVHYDEKIKTAMVHAGIPSQWKLKKSLCESAKVENILKGKLAKKLLAEMYLSCPQKWSTKLKKWDRRRYTLMALTRMRYVYANGKLELMQKGAPDRRNSSIYPWFDAPHRKWPTNIRIVFGHWSTLGAHYSSGALCLDGGCVWGGKLVAARLTKQDKISYTTVRCSN